MAIKIPRSGRFDSPQQAARFLDEARKIAQLRHPGIVPVHDVGRDGDYCYIVSEFIEGGDLAKRLTHGKLPWQDAVRLIEEVAEILQHAHANGFVHRDIKPANILLDAKGSPYLADFGIAATGEELRQGGGNTAGTLAYMSPEQVGGRQVDARTDIYSLGVVLFELLVGRRPFAAANPAELRRAILTDDPQFPESVELPPDLKRICLKALARKPTERYSSAGEFADELKVLCEPRQGRPLAVWSIGGAAIVLLIGAGFLWNNLFPWRHEDKSRQQPLQETKQQAQERRAVEQRLQKQKESVQKKVEEVQKNMEAAIGATPDGTVDLSGRTLTDADFQRLAGSILMRELRLADTPTTDSQVAHLVACPLLETLDLSRTQVGDAGMARIANLPCLRRLVLAGTKVSDDGLKALRGPSLRRLDLSGTRITDHAVQYLRKMSRLEELRLTGTKVSDEGVETLRQSLPRCKIEK